MSSLDRCPLDQRAMDFFGISAKKTQNAALGDKGEALRDKNGNVVLALVHHRWTVCPHCGTYFGHDDNGKTVEIRKGFTKSEIESLFPTTRENDRG